jgi:hypothetical protein
MALERPGQEALGGCQVPMLTEPELDRVACFVDRPDTSTGRGP